MYILLTVAAGAGLAFQAVINARLRAVLDSSLSAAIVQVSVGLVMLMTIMLVLRQPPALPDGLSRVPWWVWTGGLLGTVYVLVSIVATAPLGAALMMASVVVGQTAASLVIDHFGWLGVDVHRLSPGRLVGAILLVVGVMLIRLR